LINLHLRFHLDLNLIEVFEYTCVRNHRGLVCGEICETKTRQYISCSFPKSINIIVTVSPLFYHSARGNCFFASCVPSVARCNNGN